jgi:NAD(P)-dependent dehydrogenase (short-subunit alcohol dehydrogenase family)
MTDAIEAVVTGAASGIGRACARRIHREGFRVLAVDKNEDGLEEFRAQGVATLVADLASEAERDRVVAAGTGARYLVNAAGMIRLRPILESGVADMRAIYPVNVEAVWDLTSRLGRVMPRGGAVVNLGSYSAKIASTIECAVYASSKAAVLSITRSFAHAFAPQGVRVNAVVPGIIDTPMQAEVLAKVAEFRHLPPDEVSRTRNATVPLGRTGTPEDCAGIIWFLLSPEADYMTGQAVNITGGQIMF